MGGLRTAAGKVGGAIKKVGRGVKHVGKTLYKHKGKIALAGAAVGATAGAAAVNHAGHTARLGFNHLGNWLGGRRERMTYDDSYKMQGRAIRNGVRGALGLKKIPNPTLESGDRGY